MENKQNLILVLVIMALVLSGCATATPAAPMSQSSYPDIPVDKNIVIHVIQNFAVKGEGYDVSWVAPAGYDSCYWPGFTMSDQPTKKVTVGLSFGHPPFLIEILCQDRGYWLRNQVVIPQFQ